MKRVAFVVLMSLLFGMVQPAFAVTIRSDEPENYGGLPVIIRAVAGGILGFLLLGFPGAFAGAGLMAITDTSTGCYCEGGGGPLGPIVVK